MASVNPPSASAAWSKMEIGCRLHPGPGWVASLMTCFYLLCCGKECGVNVMNIWVFLMRDWELMTSIIKAFTLKPSQKLSVIESLMGIWLSLITEHGDNSLGVDVLVTRLQVIIRDGLGGGGGGVLNTPPPPNVADWVGQILTELDHQKWPTLIFCLIKEFELVKPQHWPTWVGHTSTLADLSWSNLNIDWLELVIPQHWLIWVGQTSILTDSSWSNLNIDRLELVKPQHWPTRVGQTSTMTDSSWSSLNIDQLELVKPQHWPTRVGQICFYNTPPPSPKSRTLGAIPGYNPASVLSSMFDNVEDSFGSPFSFLRKID